MKSGYLVTTLNLGLVLLLQTFWLVQFIGKFQQDISHFFNSIKSEDYSLKFHHDTASGKFKALYQSLEEANKVIRNLKRDYINQHQYFQFLVENLQVGLISFDDEGNIQLVNNSALDLLGLKNLVDLSQLNTVKEGLSDLITNLKVSEPEILPLQTDEGILHLSVKVSRLKIKNQFLNLLSLQNINTELETHEVNSWQKLISVLTHEIMNSVAPITSLSATLLKNFKKNENAVPLGQIDEKVINKTVSGLEIIENRSKGLVGFVDGYRKLSVIPSPTKENLSIKNLFRDVKTLLQDLLEKERVHLEIEKSSLKIYADGSQVEQVLINLVGNAIHALEHVSEKVIKLASMEQNERTIIKITDNGGGIDVDVIDKIFVPFFTTRKGGSGIGLSLCRQVMNRHRGNISVNSELGEGSTFKLSFPR